MIVEITERTKEVFWEEKNKLMMDVQVSFRIKQGPFPPIRWFTQADNSYEKNIADIFVFEISNPKQEI